MSENDKDDTYVDSKAQKHLRRASACVDINSKLTSFLYELMRDHVTPGKVQELVQDAQVAEVQYTNGWLAEYAHYLAGRLETK